MLLAQFSHISEAAVVKLLCEVVQEDNALAAVLLDFLSILKRLHVAEQNFDELAHKVGRCRFLFLLIFVLDIHVILSRLNL